MNELLILKNIYCNTVITLTLFVDCYQGYVCCFYSDVGFKQIFRTVISQHIFVHFPHSWRQNTQKLQIIFGTTEPQFNEVSRRLHREASPSDRTHRTTAGVFFLLSFLLIGLDVTRWVVHVLRMYGCFQDATYLTLISLLLWNLLIIICLFLKGVFRMAGRLFSCWKSRSSEECSE